MKEYYFDRETFCNIVIETIGYEELYETFDYGEVNQSDLFIWAYYNDEYYIIAKEKGLIINWYKHLGRCNTCNLEGITEENLKDFFLDFKEEFEYWITNKRRIEKWVKKENLN